MSFIRRNWRELLWLVFNLAMAAGCLWFATAQPDQDKKATDLWIGAVCWCVYVSVAGYWVWAVFDNRHMDEELGVFLRMVQELEQSGVYTVAQAEDVRRNLKRAW